MTTSMNRAGVEEGEEDEDGSEEEDEQEQMEEDEGDDEDQTFTVSNHKF